jgi:oligopeptide/dipeptide ABC transporter ATP-binding protein
MSDQPLLSVEGLKTHLFTRDGVVKAVDGVSFSLQIGEALGIVGESGSGKSMTCLSIMRLVPTGGQIVAGKILLEGDDLVKKSEKQMTRVRGKQVAMILQDPLMSLNPVLTVGYQVGESYLLDGVPRGARRDKTVEVLRQVNIPAAADRLRSYPFQFSGGMRQRTSAAIAISRGPKILIADEPTTSLDVTIQDQLLQLLKELREKLGMALILVTHDLGIAAEVCDRVAIMYAGRIVELGSVERVYAQPRHPYTEALLKAIPRLGAKVRRMFQIEGEPPNPVALPPGCSFHPRCPKAMDVCRQQYPPRTMLENDGYAACWLLAEGVM